MPTTAKARATRRASNHHPAGPTGAPPGSREKIEVLARRARRRLPLWHPLDAPGAARAHGNARPVAGDPMRCISRHGNRWLVRVWCRRLHRQVRVGLFATLADAQAARDRTRRAG